MPKIKDLGIKVIPETMKPPEVGGGGACGFVTAGARVCVPTVGCTDCTVQQFSICGTTPGGGGCTDCTVQNFSICGTTPGAGCGVTCSDCTVQPFSICGTTPGGCTDCTIVPFSFCGTTPCFPTIRGCGNIHTFCGCTVKGFSLCGPTIVQQPGITREQIAAMKDALRQQITALEEAEKSIGPKTAEEIDAREKQLNEELAQLKQRRKDLK